LDEYIAGYERAQSLLRDTVITEHQTKGNVATFLVVDSGGAEAVTRGVNGMIPARSNNNTQTSATLQEWHDKVRITNFNIFASQGNQRQAQQMTAMGVMNRKADSQIIDTLNTGTVAIGAGAVPSVLLFQNGIVKLQNASIPWDSNITLCCTPSFLAYLEMAPEFTKAEYVSLRPYAGEDGSWRDSPMAYRWRNCLIITHPGLPGLGTASEKSFLYHKNCMGHAVDTAGMEVETGYDKEDAYSFVRVSMNMGPALLQNAGVVVLTTDGSALS
jgi:hypothetical protein